MTSSLTASELALAERGCAALRDAKRPRVLIGGLGLGFTLRAALDALPEDARLVVAELNGQVVEWCKGPVAAVNRGAALDPRVRIVVGDVMDEIRGIAANPSAPRYDAILWDLYVGPGQRGEERDPLYGAAAVKGTWKALRDGGTFGVWGETPSPSFEARLRRNGFKAELVRPGGRRSHHAVYLATKLTGGR